MQKMIIEMNEWINYLSAKLSHDLENIFDSQ